ncbi:hypothetical protein SUGI_0614500 [Cryptomeria japonica]|nr:hypothetical protein SUGI_0614500 [Cryptomeria japonica]
MMNGFFLFSFLHPDSLWEGPWFLGKLEQTLSKWKPGFDQEVDFVFWVPVCVMLLGSLLEYWELRLHLLVRLSLRIHLLFGHLCYKAGHYSAAYKGKKGKQIIWRRKDSSLIHSLGQTLCNETCQLFEKENVADCPTEITEGSNAHGRIVSSLPINEKRYLEILSLRAREFYYGQAGCPFLPSCKKKSCDPGKSITKGRSTVGFQSSLEDLRLAFRAH